MPRPASKPAPDAPPPKAPEPTPRRKGAGRPRDPTIEPLVLAAAVELYAAEGWSNFNYDAVARRAGVGKPAVYRRWASREELLVDAIAGLEFDAAISEAPTLRAACRAAAQLNLEWWADVNGQAYLRLQTDQAAHPFLGDLYRTRVIVPLLDAFRAKVKRAVRDGEVPRGVSATLIVEALYGAVLIRMTATKPRERRRLIATPDGYLDRLVELVMTGAVAAAADTSH